MSRHKKHEEDVASDDGMPVVPEVPAVEDPAPESDEAPVVEDSDDGSTQTEADELVGETPAESESDGE